MSNTQNTQNEVIEAKKVDEKKTVDQSKKVITTNQKGKLELNSLEAQLAYAQRLLQNGVLNSSFKTPQQVVLGMQWALSRNIDPRIALDDMFVLNGKPQLYGKGPLAMCEASGKLEWCEEFWVDKNYKKICFENKNLHEDAFAAVCRAKRKDSEVVQEDYFTISDMKAAKLSGPVWQKYQRIMMRYRARALALNNKFTDVLSGMRVAEYDNDVLPEQSFLPQPNEKLSDLNKGLLD